MAHRRLSFTATLVLACSHAWVASAQGVQLSPKAEPVETPPNAANASGGTPGIRAITPGQAVQDTAAAHEPHFTLEDALRAMRAQHPALIAADQAIQAARGDRKATSLWTNPTAFGQYYKSVEHNTYASFGYPSYGITQFIEFANAPGARARAANLDVWAARGDYASTLIELTYDLQSAMIELATAQRKVALIEQALDLLDHAAHIVDQRVAAGATPRYDSTRIAVTVAMAHADFEALHADAARARGELNAAVGPGASNLHGVPYFPLDQTPELPSAEQLVELLIAHRPDLEAARKRAESAKISVSVARRQVWPGMSVSAIGGYGNAPGQLDFGVGLSVPVPVVDRGQGTIPAAQARAQAAQANYDSILVPAKLRIYGMHQEVVTRRKAYDEYVGRAVATGDEMLKEAQAGYLAGRFSILELVDAYVSWRDSRLRAVDLAAAARSAEVDLGRTIGIRLGAKK